MTLNVKLRQSINEEAEYGGDMKAYNLALSQRPLTGFMVVRLEPAKPFAWNRGERPSRLNAAAGV